MNITHYIFTLKTTIFKQNNWKQNDVSKWRPNKWFLARVISILAKIKKKIKKNKKHFPEIIIVGEHKYSYNVEKKNTFPKE